MKVGILGGGQLGRMLLQQAANYPVETWVMENDTHCPSAHLCHHFIKGDIRDFDAVYAFGQLVDSLTIEIEHVNVEALEILEKEGKTIVPSPAALRTIKDKILQKQCYLQNQLPSPSFLITKNKLETINLLSFLPAVQKLAVGGYDGKGVQVLKNEKDIEKAFDAPSVLEKMVDIYKEIAITVAIDINGQFVCYPPVEMVFDPILNLLDYQICPADLPTIILEKAKSIAIKTAKAFQSPGLFAIELFVDNSNEIWVNETAPRVHNSGHHTIEAHYSSQFDMLWRIILNYPLGETNYIKPSVMVNLVGAEGFKGDVFYRGLEDVLSIPNVFVHLYGKLQTSPGRKMGHITIMGDDVAILMEKATLVKQKLTVIAKES
ncbi:MAG: 5-(carboxyamino)imidazole ribonucleotide synthase [Chitinophagaceae bacterium]|nr:5-(carboxyamino)imidazole ribonucleotide synthase [Chitinophagaceae bacterium]